MIKNIEAVLQFKKVIVQTFEAECLPNNITLDILRLDLLHPVISGNKWFKLKYYLQDALEKSFAQVVTFGGTYSNHIVATAFACNVLKLECTGIIRGEQPAELSHSLKQAQEYGMKLKFVSRNQFNNTDEILQQFANAYYIPQGGYGELGLKGVAEILSFIPALSSYTHIVCAVGMGTTLAGIVHASLSFQQIIGISIMKENKSLEQEINSLLSQQDKSKSLILLHQFHCGGYAKKTNDLIQFMQTTWNENKLPTDFVYTAKTLYAIKKLVAENYFPPGSKILMIHSGGLQGNNSLPTGVLPFSI